MYSRYIKTYGFLKLPEVLRSLYLFDNEAQEIHTCANTILIYTSKEKMQMALQAEKAN